MSSDKIFTSKQREFLGEYMRRVKTYQCYGYLDSLGKKTEWEFYDIKHYSKSFFPKPPGKCERCGQRLRWEFTLKNKKGRERARVGPECLVKHIDLNRGNIKRLREICEEVEREWRRMGGLLRKHKSWESYVRAQKISEKVELLSGSPAAKNLTDTALDFKNHGLPLGYFVERRIETLFRKKKKDANVQQFIKSHPELCEKTNRFRVLLQTFFLPRTPEEKTLLDLWTRIEERGSLTVKEETYFRDLLQKYLDR